MTKWFLAALLVSFGTGCATGPLGTAYQGGANYSYTKGQDGCNIVVGSARELVGASVKIEDCDLTIDAETTPTDDALSAILELIRRMP